MIIQVKHDEVILGELIVYVLIDEINIKYDINLRNTYEFLLNMDFTESMVYVEFFKKLKALKDWNDIDELSVSQNNFTLIDNLSKLRLSLTIYLSTLAINTKIKFTFKDNQYNIK